MPTLNFPDSPTLNQEYTYEGITWTWTGQYWQVQHSSFTNHFIPSANVTYDLGSSSNRWRDLYLSGNSLHLGSAQITSTDSAVNLPAGSTLGGQTIVTSTVSSISNHDTDDLVEGTTNKYFSNSLARSAISVTGAGSYNSGTGVITITGGVTSVNSYTGAVILVTDDIAEDGSTSNLWYTNARARGAISITDSGGDGSLSYDNSTGVITYTGPSATDVRAHLSAGTGLTYTTGQFAIDSTVATLTGTQTLTNKTLISPTINAATIGGHLIPSVDVTYDLGSASYRFRDLYFSDLWATTANVETLNFTGTGAVVISSGNDLNFTATGNITFNGSQLATVATSGSYNDLSNTPTLAAVATSGSYNDLSNKPTLVTNLDSLTDVVITSASNGQVLKYNGTNWVNDTAPAGGVTSVNSQTGAVTLTTTNIAEGTNLYYTDTRARSAISVSGNATYNSSTGVITVTSGGGETTGQNLTFNNSGSGAASGSSFNGSAALTISYNTIGAAKTDGTNATGTWGIGITGNAATATTLATARNINGVSFNGSADITVTAAAGTLTGSTLASGVTASSLTSIGTLTNVQANRYSRTVQNLTPAAGTATIDLASGSCIVLTLTSAISGWTLQNVPSGVEFEFRMYIVANGGSISAWPTGTKWALGSAPQITTTAGKIDVISFTTYDGGTSWIALIAGQNF
jgi:hypothetical protein